MTITTSGQIAKLDKAPDIGLSGALLYDEGVHWGSEARITVEKGETMTMLDLTRQQLRYLYQASSTEIEEV